MRTQRSLRWHPVCTGTRRRGLGRAAQVGRAAVLPAGNAGQAGGSSPSLRQPSGMQKFRKCSASKSGRLEGELTSGPVNDPCVHVCIGT